MAPMLRSGEDYLAGIRDGRAVYIGKEQVADVTDHPAFANAARMYAAMYDLKRADDMRDVLWVERERRAVSGLVPQSRRSRRRPSRSAPRRTAPSRHSRTGCWGARRTMWRPRLPASPSGLRRSTATAAGSRSGSTPITGTRRARDLYLAYAILPPQGARKPELYQSADKSPPTLRVTSDEDNEGVVLNGMKMLATGAVFADELWIGNIVPLAPSQVKESVTCAVPVNAPGRRALGAQAVRRGAGDRVPQPARPPLRRIGFDDRVRRRARALGPSVFVHDKSRPVARHLRRDAGALHVEPSVERALRRQAPPADRARVQDRARSNGARDIPGGAGRCWASSPRWRRPTAPSSTASCRRFGGDRQRLRPRQRALHVRGDQLCGRELRQDLRPGSAP